MIPSYQGQLKRLGLDLTWPTYSVFAFTLFLWLYIEFSDLLQKPNTFNCSQFSVVLISKKIYKLNKLSFEN